MNAKAESQLTPRQRLSRGLAYSAIGPVDVARGAIGLGAHSVQSTASELHRRYREGQLARDIAAAQETLAQELAAAQEVVSSLPEALQSARKSQRRRGKRPLLIAGVAVVVLAGGAAAFSIVRRSVNRDSPESPRPPSVDVQPRP
ncbi:MAG: cell wall synthesis protein CwsA [Actinomycetota bacterium]|uniref:Cell wall synthesis protein CwsA n=1 Tax=Mycobacterium lentiflavum TaxID=141349 RepID=A0ABY3UYK5_MYCLN|nr:cell wall synthesis protein CwsA [Mycobacterium lentiflavum]MEE3065956.1 cell wall synthesis protein CwsA [Actinomycetota bacterium]ULP42463.1 cell wall synthesis protein CwsA [Mycobacterium lentiflavum]